ncbi:MAG TPA: hypothetical protein VFG07_04420 [Thermoplasmata archaeon]|nr:hypothetical protein [Thermoplasmata archaeon]
MPVKIGTGSGRGLLQNPKVRSWHAARSLKSRLSADVDLRKLRLLLHRLGLDPESVVTEATENAERFQDALIRYASDLKRVGRVDDYIAKTLSGLKSYLRFRRVPFSGYPSLNPIRGSTLTNERVPTPEELARVLEFLTLRGKTIALLMAHAGVRPQVIGDYSGERGLILEDLPELDLEELKFAETPFVIRVPADLSKTRTSYRTFGTSQLASTLGAYLTDRRAAGEPLTAKSPVVAPIELAILRGATRDSRRMVGRSRRFMVTGALVREIRAALHASPPRGVTWRPYVLRSYCSTRLLLAEGQGRISRDLREALLGHSGGIASRYNVGKRWGQELIAEARREYANSAEFLETTTPTRTNVAAEFRKTLLEVAGLNDAEAARHMDDSNEEVVALLRNRLVGKESALPSPSYGNGIGIGSSLRVQKPVPLSEAEALLAQGWTFVANFGSDRVLLQAPKDAASPFRPVPSPGE